MSVLITGMEMPKSCSVCPMLEGDRMDGLCHAASKWLDDDEHWTWYAYPEGDIDDSKPCNCPLVPVPPHVDLIDRDALGFDYISITDEGIKIYTQRGIDAATTVIPEEEGER